MLSNKEELIEFSFERDLQTGEFNADILVKSTAIPVEVSLNYSTPYVSIPLHFDYAYIFRLEPKVLYYFKIKKDSLETFEHAKIEFDVMFDEKKILKQLRKMLDRADFYEDWNAYKVLQKQVALTEPIENLIDVTITDISEEDYKQHLAEDEIEVDEEYESKLQAGEID